jgi:hypothetical protein
MQEFVGSSPAQETDHSYGYEGIGREPALATTLHIFYSTLQTEDPAVPTSWFRSGRFQFSTYVQVELL